jgi:hypothetical protein
VCALVIDQIGVLLGSWKVLAAPLTLLVLLKVEPVVPRLLVAYLATVLLLRWVVGPTGIEYVLVLGHGTLVRVAVLADHVLQFRLRTACFCMVRRLHLWLQLGGRLLLRACLMHLCPMAIVLGHGRCLPCVRRRVHVQGIENWSDDVRVLLVGILLRWVLICERVCVNCVIDICDILRPVADRLAVRLLTRASSVWVLLALLVIRVEWLPHLLVLQP